MRKYLSIAILGFLVTACSFPPYDEEGQEKQALLALGFTEFNHKIDGRNVHGVKSGDAKQPAVIFIHGAPSDWRAWGGYLADKDLIENVHMIAIDRTGYKGSELGNWEGSLKIQARTVLEAALKEHPGPFLIVGHSFGGPVAVQAAIDYPKEAEEIIILAGSIDPELEETKWFQYVADFFLFRWAVPERFDVANQEIFALKGELEDQQQYLDQIKQPVLVIQGEDDELVPPGNADYAQEHLTEAELEIIRIPNQGHFLPWEQYDLVKSKILKYAKEKQ